MITALLCLVLAPLLLYVGIIVLMGSLLLIPFALAAIAVLALAMTAALGTGWLWVTLASCTVPKPASDKAA